MIRNLSVVLGPTQENLPFLICIELHIIGYQIQVNNGKKFLIITYTHFESTQFEQCLKKRTFSHKMSFQNSENLWDDCEEKGRL